MAQNHTAGTRSMETALGPKKISLAALMRHRAHEQFQSVRDGNGPLPVGQRKVHSRPRLIEDANPANHGASGSPRLLKVAQPLKSRQSLSDLRSPSRSLSKCPSTNNLKLATGQGKGSSKRVSIMHHAEESPHLSREYFTHSPGCNASNPVKISSRNDVAGTLDPNQRHPKQFRALPRNSQAQPLLQHRECTENARSTNSPRVRVKDLGGEENRNPASPTKTFRIKPATTFVT